VKFDVSFLFTFRFLLLNCVTYIPSEHIIEMNFVQVGWLVCVETNYYTSHIRVFSYL